VNRYRSWLTFQVDLNAESHDEAYEKFREIAQNIEMITVANQTAGDNEIVFSGSDTIDLVDGED